MPPSGERRVDLKEIFYQIPGIHISRAVIQITLPPCMHSTFPCVILSSFSRNLFTGLLIFYFIATPF